MFASQLPGSQQLWKVLAEGGPAEQFTKEGGLRGDWSPAGDRIAYDVDTANRLRIAEASSGKLLREVKGSGNEPDFTCLEPGREAHQHARKLVGMGRKPDSGEPRLAIQFPQGYHLSFPGSLTPDGKSVVVNKQVTTSRIVLLENF